VKAALVTGGSRGIGLALARRLVAEGYALTLVARSPQAAARELGCAWFAADLLQEHAVRAAVAHHADVHGRLDVLVNNAGTGMGQDVDDLKTSRVDVQLALNLRTPILFYREALPLLRAAGGAWVVNVASVAGLDGQPWLSVYSAAKAGLIAFTQAMNSELDGVRSCALCPGTVDTELTAYMEDRRRLIPPEDVAEALAFLLRLSPNCVVPRMTLG
jgi:3-oxoacyl-[acyl-carrier protein] reductase